MDTRPMNTDYSTPEWSWPSWKFDLEPEALFNGLYDRYNTTTIPIQDAVAFHHDVLEIGSTATTVAEFHASLKQRQRQRVKELQQCWDAVSIRIASCPSVLEGEQDEASVARRWSAFLHLSREFSFDALARYFGLFTHSSTPSPLLPNETSISISSSLSDEQSGRTPASTMSTVPTQSLKRASSPATCIDDGNELLHPSKRLRIERQPSNRSEQSPNRETESAVPTQSRKRASSPATCIDDGNELLHPSKRLRIRQEIFDESKQRPSRETNSAFPTSTIHSMNNPDLRRSSRIKALIQAARSGSPKVSDRSPTNIQSTNTLIRHTSRRRMPRRTRGRS